MAYKDPEQRKRYAKEYRLKHPDYQKKWYRLNLEKQRKYFRDRGRKQWRENAKIRAEAPARAKLYRARRVKRGLPAQSPSVKIWHKNNPDLVRALRRIQEQNRRSRLRADGGKVTKQEWLEVVAMFQSRCAYCGEHFTQGALEMDHSASSLTRRKPCRIQHRPGLLSLQRPKAQQNSYRVLLPR